MTKKVSMKDIANKLGVSTALVSYVLNGLEKEKRVSQKLVKEIHQAAKEMNYKTNQVARSLRKGSTNSIGLIVADISNPFFSQLARIIEDEAATYGYTVVFGSSDESSDKSANLIEILVNRQVDGLIIVPTEGSEKQIKNLVQNEVPLVLFDRYIPGISTNYVVLDNYSATYAATKCLIEKGYQKICMIAYKSKMIHMRERIRGYKEAMKDNGFSREIRLEEVRYNDVNSDVEMIIKEIIPERSINAILFSTNALSICGLYAIREQGIKIPEELAIIGFDGHEVFDFFHPPLSYIKQPLEEMGKESVKILLKQIKGSREKVHIEFNPELIKRASC